MADTFRDLESYVARAQQSRAQFVADNPWPFLVRLPDVLPERDPWSDDFSFTTHVPGIEDMDDDDDMKSENAVVIQAVKKRPGGPFPLRVGVGRTRNSDVSLRFGTVSKLHAQFFLDEPPWTLVDLDSANGTFVNDERLAPKRPRIVPIGARVRFGSVETELLDAGTLYDRLRALRP